MVSTGDIDLEDLFGDPEDPQPQAVDLFGIVLRDRERRARARMWLAQDGREIAYDKLGNKHLINILMWLRRQAQAEAEREAGALHLTLSTDGWRACTPPEWTFLIEEALSRQGMVANAAQLIDGPQGLDEEMIRRAIR